MEPDLRFDPAVPALPLVADLEAVASLFAAQGHEVSELRRQDVKYTPLTRCVASYAVTITGGAGGRRRTVAAVVVTPAGTSLRLADDDEGLPGLAEALDPACMLPRLDEALAPAERVTGCTATPVRYKFGARCTVRYDVRTATGAGTLYGKLAADGWRERLATLAALARAGRDRPAMPGILPVVAHWGDLHLLLQPAAEGAAELNQRAFDPAEPEKARDGWLWAAGRHLGGLHACRLPDALLSLAGGDLDELRACAAPMAQADQRLAHRYRSIVDLLEQRAGAGPPEPAVTSHGAMRTDQFLIVGDRLVMIDLDTVRRSEPARDLGNLLAYLDWKAIRLPALAPFCERGARMVLDGYAGVRPAPEGPRLALQRATSLLKIAGRRYRSLTVREWPLVPRLLDAAATALASA